MSTDYKEASEKYKNSKKMPDIEEEYTYPKRKKKKKVKKTNHKHIYVPAIYYYIDTGFNGEKIKHIDVGFHCSVCGRIRDLRFIFAKREEQIEKFKKQNPDYVEIHLPEGWDCFKDKYIPV